MKKLITILTAAALAAAMTTTAFGQAAGPAGSGVQSGAKQKGDGQGKAHGIMGKKLVKALDLTPDQQKQLKALSEKYQAKRKEIQAGGKGQRKQAAELHKQFMEDLNKILTPEQQAKLKRFQEERKKGGGDRPGTGTTNKGGGGGL